MQFDNLGVVEKKVLKALMLMANDNNVVKTNMKDIAKAIGYKKPGGAITFALKILERDNFVARLPEDKTYEILI